MTRTENIYYYIYSLYISLSRRISASLTLFSTSSKASHDAADSRCSRKLSSGRRTVADRSSSESRCWTIASMGCAQCLAHESRYSSDSSEMQLIGFTAKRKHANKIRTAIVKYRPNHRAIQSHHSPVAHGLAGSKYPVTSSASFSGKETRRAVE